MALDEVSLDKYSTEKTISRRKKEKRAANKHVITISADDNGLLRDTEVPEGFRTVFIKTGYRKPGLSLKGCLNSVLEPTNETVNVWSHVVALVLFTLRFYNAFHSISLADSWSYPLTTFAIGIASLMVMSSTAHLFNCISLSFHHIGFYLDYAAISVYSFSGAQAFFFYSRPARNASSVFLLQSPAAFMILSASMSWICTFFCCLSRHRWKKKSYVVRTSFFIVYFVVVTFPFTYRVALGSTDERKTESVHYFIRHVITYIISALVNMLKIPERYFPGLFDFFGQSHHFLHLFAALGASDAFSAVYVDMKERHDTLAERDASPDIYNTWISFLVVIVVNLSIVCWFAKSLLNQESSKSR